MTHIDQTAHHIFERQLRLALFLIARLFIILHIFKLPHFPHRRSPISEMGNNKIYKTNVTHNFHGLWQRCPVQSVRHQTHENRKTL